ncbi:MAG: muconolactone Delta-isomerase family protein [Terracidiphilus sp.]
MRFLSLLRLRTEAAHRDIVTPQLVRQEIDRVHELLVSGTVREAWKIRDSIAIFLLVEADSEDQCRSILATLPFSDAGVLEIEMVVPVEPYIDAFPVRAQDG